MDFSEALHHLKAGAKMARSGWNGKNMFVVMMSALNLPPFNTQGTARKVNDCTAVHIGEDAPLNSRAYLAMKMADGTWQPGWLAAQPDLFADDWYVV